MPAWFSRLGIAGDQVFLYSSVAGSDSAVAFGIFLMLRDLLSHTKSVVVCRSV
jgi:hypothetical protein